MSVVTGLVVSFAKPWPFLRSSRRRLRRGLAGCSSASSCGVGERRREGGVGEHRRGGGVGEHLQGGGDGERCAVAVFSSSHVDVANSSRRRLLGLDGGVGKVRGGYMIVRY